jgi:ATP/maltotriose-dependent transcriptional regulator MalT
LWGRYKEAEAAYRSASQWGLEPQPGLALLRLAQGDVPAAVAAIRRALDTATDRVERSRLLPASVEIACAAGEAERAHADCGELEAIADALGSEALHAVAGCCRGMVELARGAAGAAVAPLRSAFQAWSRLEAPYFASRARLLLSRAYAAMGDADGAALERDAARAEFHRLGASPDLAALDRDGAPFAVPGGLTARELQVLKLVARGRTNKAIARELKISGKTVDRHLSNIFTKLDVPSRAASVAYAYQHKLI